MRRADGLTDWRTVLDVLQEP
eukprot:SAG22_NODE_14738_length_366_cov_0.970037_1_plen_20_part_10